MYGVPCNPPNLNVAVAVSKVWEIVLLEVVVQEFVRAKMRPLRFS
jgi:hypothetical protein